MRGRRWSSKVCWSNEGEKITFLSNDHRMMQVTKDLRWHLAWPWAEAGRAVRPGEVAWGFIQSGLENLQGQKPHNFSVRPVPPLCCRYGEKLFFVKMMKCLILSCSYWGVTAVGRREGEGVVFLPLALPEALWGHGGGHDGVSSRCGFRGKGHASQPRW